MRPRGAGSEIAPGYEVVAHLARSRTYDLYDAWSERLRCLCVLKALRPDMRADEKARRRLEHEGRVLERLCHPSIVRGYETVLDPHPLVAMETLAGETLAHLIERRRLTAVELAFLGLQLSSAMGYLHGEGMLHLDLKPANVIAEAGRAKLIDLSVAQAAGAVPAGVGTWCYMAPEQARGGTVGPAADVWGIGVVLYAAVAGDTPFATDGEAYPQLERRAPRLRALRPRLPGALTATVDACLEPGELDRPSIGELRAGLESVAGARG